MPLATDREEGCTEKCFLQYSENGSFMEKKDGQQYQHEQ